jgi:hypothetical protein
MAAAAHDFRTDLARQAAQILSRFVPDVWLTGWHPTRAIPVPWRNGFAEKIG